MRWYLGSSSVIWRKRDCSLNWKEENRGRQEVDRKDRKGNRKNLKGRGKERRKRRKRKEEIHDKENGQRK